MSQLVAKVKEWLDDQGYPLEMQAASAFRAAGFEVQQSRHYIDAETGKSREIDMIVTDPDHVGIIRINLALECKSSKKPWILFSSRHSTEGHDRLFTYALTSESMRSALSDRFFEPEVSQAELMKGNCPIYERLMWMRKDGLIGYSARQAFSDADVAYAATIGAVKAARYLVDGDGTRRSAEFRLAFPVVVIDGSLLRCYLDESDEVRLEEIEEGEVYFSFFQPDYVGTCVRVVTIRRLAQFALDARAEVAQLRLELKDEEAKVRQKWHDQSAAAND